MKKYLLILIVSIFFLPACASTQTVLMKNPQTGDIKECKRDTWKHWSWQEEAVIKDCKEKYEKAGYVEVK
ncbi:MAG: hypothetical protein A2Z82_01095 [Nitrospirae bacterium GWA2_46_11]|nr:MAG: hypothetical protein A2Z82_01095 [Nitrospirae bacterium GWA2_46_11]